MCAPPCHQRSLAESMSTFQPWPLVCSQPIADVRRSPQSVIMGSRPFIALVIASGAPLAGCTPGLTADVTLGTCAQFVLPSDSNRDVDSSLHLSADSSEASGRAEMIGDPDDYPRRYRITGPAIARFSVDRAARRNSFEFSLPVGRAVTFTDERDNVRCEVADDTS